MLSYFLKIGCLNASNKRRIERKSAAFIRGRRLIIFLLIAAAFIRGRRLFEGGVYSNNYGMYSFQKFFVSFFLTPPLPLSDKSRMQINCGSPAYHMRKVEET